MDTTKKGDIKNIYTFLDDNTCVNTIVSINHGHANDNANKNNDENEDHLTTKNENGVNNNHYDKTPNNDNAKPPKNAKQNVCELCNFTCSKNCDWLRHLATVKHTLLINNTKKTPKECVCVCGKKYKFMSSLCYHKKKCPVINPSLEEKPIIKEQEQNVMNDVSANLIFELVKQNKEFQQLLVEQNQKIFDQNQKMLEMTKPTNNVINSNNNNTKFNLNVFLNEQCKDALNITDFVNSLKLQLKDLENTGKFGFSEGISKIFIRGLNELDIYKRPIHCSDLKRETMYIKDQNIWEKENSEKEKMKKTIDKIALKNVHQIPKWMEEHPKCQEYTSKYNDQYLQIVNESMGGIDKEEYDKFYSKIVKNISKEVSI